MAKVYPDLVIRGPAGRIDGVRYDELAPILLNEMQRRDKEMQRRDQEFSRQAEEIRQLRQQMADMRALLIESKNGDPLLAQR